MSRVLPRSKSRAGGMLIESILTIPVLVLLVVGGLELGKIALTYYQLQKTLRAGARMVAVLQGADFCNPDDTQITAVKNFIVYGPDADASNPVVRDLTIERVLITPERADLENGAINVCDCGGSDGCLASDGGRPPDYVRLSIDGGYSFQHHIPFRTLDPILLRPHVRAPFGGL